MAIHPRLHSEGVHLSPQQARAISAWTEQHAAASMPASMQGMTLSDPAEPSTPTRAGLRGTTVSLSIPLEDEPAPKVESHPTVRFRRTPLRESKTRETLLKGKDGSRRRQRWENGMSLPSRERRL